MHIAPLLTQGKKVRRRGQHRHHHNNNYIIYLQQDRRHNNNKERWIRCEIPVWCIPGIFRVLETKGYDYVVYTHQRVQWAFIKPFDGLSTHSWWLIYFYTWAAANIHSDNILQTKFEEFFKWIQDWFTKGSIYYLLFWIF